MREMLIGLLIVGTMLIGCAKEDPLDNPCSSESIKLEPANYADYECNGPTVSGVSIGRYNGEEEANEESYD